MALDAIVVGGGLAGLSAATALAEAGARVCVLEARPSLGGRAATFTDPVTGDRVDNGQHVVIGGYDETFRFLRRIGSERDVHLQRDLTVDVVDGAGRASRLACPPLPAPFHLAAGVLRWDALAWRDRLAAWRVVREVGRAARSGSEDGPAEAGHYGGQASPGKAGHYDGPAGPAKAGHYHGWAEAGHSAGPAEAGHYGEIRDARAVTVRAWLEQLGQTPRLIELLWEPLAVAALNQSIDEAAAAPFAGVLRRMFGWRRRDAALGLPLKPLEDLYAAPARAFVEARGGSVRLGAPARISCASGLSVRVRDEDLRASAVVCAVPWHALAATFDEPPAALGPMLDAAAHTAASPIVTVNLWLDRPVTRGMFLGLPGRTMQWVFDTRTLFGESSSHLSLVSSGASAIVSRGNEDLIALAMRELAGALPAARSASVRRAVVVRERRATFSVAPGQPARPGTRTPIDGLFMAGDWIATGLPATIEGAVLSGHLAARAALGRDGRP